MYGIGYDVHDMGDGLMSNWIFPVILLIVLVLMIGYMPSPGDYKNTQKYDLPESMYDEIHSYRMCMEDRSCRMFVRIKQ